MDSFLWPQVTLICPLPLDLTVSDISYHWVLRHMTL